MNRRKKRIILAIISFSLTLTLLIGGINNFTSVNFPSNQFFTGNAYLAKSFDTKDKEMSAETQDLKVVDHPGAISVKGENISQLLEKDRKVMVNKGMNGYKIDPYVVNTNNIGLRDENISEKGEDDIRILVIGDSHTFGWGVAKSERFTDVVSKRMDTENIEIINAAIHGWGMKDFLDFYEHKGKELNPDIIVIPLVPNDELSVEKQREFRKNFSSKKETRQKMGDFIGNSSHKKNSSLRRNARALINQTESKIVFYQIKDFAKGYNTFWNSLDTRKNVQYTSLPKKIEESDEWEFLIRKNVDNHYNKEGHRILAEKLYRSLIEIPKIENKIEDN